ncbi:MAG: hypothetical protein WCA11_08525, partial [Terracidiphilus sp.]
SQIAAAENTHTATGSMRESRSVPATAEPVPRPGHIGTSQPSAHSAHQATEDANHSVQAHPGLSPAQSPSPALGMQASIPGIGSAKPGAGASATGNSTVDAHDLFSTMDSESGSLAPMWIHAGARQAEAGFQDPALGWVGVRAQADTSGIHAVLVPGSADSAQTLSSHLAGLNDYLQHHEASVQTVTMGSPESHQTGFGMDQGAGQSAGHGTYGGESSGGHTDSESGTSSSATLANQETVPTIGEFDTLPLGGLPGGVYISVMA